ncbi:MAG: PilZ domain-containing protein [Candidatus Acidiferrales bacterium]
MRSAVNWEELGIEASQDRRSETRLPLAVSVEVSGFDLAGRFFSERTKTVDISESGCSFHLKNDIARGSIVGIRIKSEAEDGSALRRPLLYQVARSEHVQSDWIVGAAKLQPESIWLAFFPKTDLPHAH